MAVVLPRGKQWKTRINEWMNEYKDPPSKIFDQWEKKWNIAFVYLYTTLDRKRLLLCEHKLSK